MGYDWFLCGGAGNQPCGGEGSPGGSSSAASQPPPCPDPLLRALDRWSGLSQGVSHTAACPRSCSGSRLQIPLLVPGRRLLSPLGHSPGMLSISVSGVPRGEARGSAAEPCWPPTSLSACGGSGACVLPYDFPRAPLRGCQLQQVRGLCPPGPQANLPRALPSSLSTPGPPATTTRARSLKAKSRSCLQPPVPRLRKPSS